MNTESILAHFRALPPNEALLLAAAVLDGPIGDILTGDEMAEHGIANAINGLENLADDRA